MLKTNARKLDTVLNGCLALIVLKGSSVLLILNGWYSYWYKRGGQCQQYWYRGWAPTLSISCASQNQEVEQLRTSHSILMLHNLITMCTVRCGGNLELEAKSRKGCVGEHRTLLLTKHIFSTSVIWATVSSSETLVGLSLSLV